MISVPITITSNMTSIPHTTELSATLIENLTRAPEIVDRRRIINQDAVRFQDEGVATRQHQVEPDGATAAPA
jgi:hypothetical protein